MEQLAFAVTLIYFIILLFLYGSRNKAQMKLEEKERFLKVYEEENAGLRQKLADLGYEEYSQVRQEVLRMRNMLAEKRVELDSLCDIVFALQEDEKKKKKNVQSLVNKIAKTKTLFEAMQHAVSDFIDFNTEIQNVSVALSAKNKQDLEELLPTV